MRRIVRIADLANNIINESTRVGDTSPRETYGPSVQVKTWLKPHSRTSLSSCERDVDRGILGSCRCAVPRSIGGVMPCSERKDEVMRLRRPSWVLIAQLLGVTDKIVYKIRCSYAAPVVKPKLFQVNAQILGVEIRLYCVSNTRLDSSSIYTAPGETESVPD